MIYYLLYNFILLLGSPLIALYLLQRYFSGKSKPGWRERWGHLPATLRANPNGRPRIWVHAVSAGEVVAAVPILRELRTALPNYDLLLSVITPAGMEMARQQAAKYTDGLFYFPFDLPPVARRVVTQICPQVFVSLESEMWPNVLHELKRSGARTVMVNGRISDKNFRRASGRGRFFYRWMLGNMDKLLMQSEADAQRIQTLGEFDSADRVAVLGNSKFDQDIVRLSPAETLALRHSLQLSDDAPVFVAGSTRSPEEEAEVISAYKKMTETCTNLCLIMAPRQIDRATEVAAAMHSAGLEPNRRTELPSGVSSDRNNVKVKHLILDTMGELANVYAVADIAFVGNSFPPVVKGGGQNLLQPLAHGKPVLFGPLTATIRSEVALATQSGVGFQVQDGAELAAEGSRLLKHAELRADIETRALNLIAANRGVSARYAAAVAELANTPGSALSERKKPFSREEPA